MFASIAASGLFSSCDSVAISLRLVVVERLELADQLALPVERAGVEHRPAQVAADLERGVDLGVGPLRRRRAPG